MAELEGWDYVVSQFVGDPELNALSEQVAAIARRNPEKREEITRRFEEMFRELIAENKRRQLETTILQMMRPEQQAQFLALKEKKGAEWTDTMLEKLLPDALERAVARIEEAA